MTKFNTKKKLKSLKGEEIKNEKKEGIFFGDLMADALSAARKNPARCFQFAKKFATQKEVELKAEDVVFLKEIIEEHGFMALTAGQLLEELGE